MKNIVNFENENKTKKRLNKKKMMIAIAIIVFVLIIGITALIYYSSRNARKFIDQYIFRKNITQEKLASIELDYNSNVSVFAYNKYICILAENKLMQYNSSGKLEKEIQLEINNPVYSVNNKYIAISEKNGSKLNLISGSEILWTQNVDGNISKINVNENGYVSVILTGTTYKSVIVTFDKDGNKLFKNYLANTTAVDTSISKDNKYLAYAEVNTSGTNIQSNIKVISIEKANEKTSENENQSSSESIVYTYSADTNKLIIDIEYQGNDKIICMYDDEIAIIKNESSSELFPLVEKGKNINFSNINLDNHIYRAIEENDGLFNTNTVIEIKDTNTEKTTVYTVEGTSKYIYSFNNIIAVSLGQEIEFINTNGWLLKRYSSSQEVQDVEIGNGIAGIVYKDKVEIINL